MFNIALESLPNDQAIFLLDFLYVEKVVPEWFDETLPPFADISPNEWLLLGCLNVSIKDKTIVFNTVIKPEHFTSRLEIFFSKHAGMIARFRGFSVEYLSEYIEKLKDAGAMFELKLAQLELAVNDLLYHNNASIIVDRIVSDKPKTVEMMKSLLLTPPQETLGSRVSNTASQEALVMSPGTLLAKAGPDSPFPHF